MLLEARSNNDEVETDIEKTAARGATLAEA
jgi:hypothetical protein